MGRTFGLPTANSYDNWEIIRSGVLFLDCLIERGEGSWEKRTVRKIFKTYTLKSNTKKLKYFGFLSLFKNNKFLSQMHSFRH